MRDAQDLPETRPTLASWRIALCVFTDRPQPEVRPCGATHGEEKESSLGVVHRRNTLPCRLFQDLPHVLRVADGNVEDLHPLLSSWPQRIASPYHCVGFHNSGCSGHLLHSVGCNAASVPDLGLAMVHVDEGVRGQVPPLCERHVV